MIVFTPSAHRPSVSAAVVRLEDHDVVVDTGGKEMRLNLRKVDSFDVARPRKIEVAPGDKLLIRANDKKLGLVNGQILTAGKITPNGSIICREGVSIPAEFRQWCHGYVVTSHKAQGRTADHVIIAAENLAAKGAYVASSRGRLSCALHTPDKVRLLDRLPEGDRKAILDVQPPGSRFSLGVRVRPAMWENISPLKRAGGNRLPFFTKGVQLAKSSVERLVHQFSDNSAKLSLGQ
jgi:hypothetical protein